MAISHGASASFDSTPFNSKAFDFDFFVIGAGSGGVRAARVAAQLGARVAVAESSALGGTCVNLGCIPKKLFVYAAAVSSELEDAAGYGWQIGESRFDWAALRAAKDREIARLNGVYGRLLEQAGVRTLSGRARVEGPNEVSVGGQVYSARYVLVATGGRPRPLQMPGAQYAVTSDQMFSLSALPRRVLVLGGGFIGVEFACILHKLGCEVEVVHTHAMPLPGFDQDVQLFLRDELEHQGIRWHLHTQVQSLEHLDASEPTSALVSGSSGPILATLKSGVQIEADLVLGAIGRIPNTEGLGLEQAGVMLGDRGEVLVDAEYRTSVPSIFAVGDAINRMALTPVALAEAMRVAQRLFGSPMAPLDYGLVPAAVFSQPPVAAAGLTEQAARAAGHRVRVYESNFKPLKLTLSARLQRTMMKLVVDDQTDRVLGVHMVGQDAPEIIQGFATALLAGATKAQFDATVGIHPTAAEEFVTMRTPRR